MLKDALFNTLREKLMNEFAGAFASGELFFEKDNRGFMSLFRRTPKNRYHISKRVALDGTTWYIIWGKATREVLSDKKFFVSKHRTASEAKIALCQGKYM